MFGKIKVSIVIPVYNVEKYLEKCLNSIFDQSLKEIEVICVDDASTDASTNILQDYKKAHDNMKVIIQNNSGAGIARNIGIKVSNGEYLMFIDPDDYLAADDVVEALYITAERNAVDVCGGSIVKLKDGVISREYPKKRRKNIVEKEGMICFRDYQYPYGHTRYIIKRELLLNNHILYPEYRRGQDVLFMAKVLNTAGELYLIKKDIYINRVLYKDEKFTMKNLDDMMNALDDVLNLAICNNLEDLFDIMVAEINYYAKQYWYREVKENKTWDKIANVNNVIEQGNAHFQYEKHANLLMSELEYDKYFSEIKEQMVTIEETIRKKKKFVIYGAGEAGKAIYKYLLVRGYSADYFVVSDAGENAKVVQDVPVISVDELKNASEYLYVLGAFSNEVRTEMKRYLEDRGCYNILEFDCAMDSIKILSQI